MGNQAMRIMTLLLGAVVCAVTAGLAAGQAASSLDKSSGGSVPALSSSKGQAYPTKPIRMIAPYPPGGTSDIVARIVGQKLFDAWGRARGGRQSPGRQRQPRHGNRGHGQRGRLHVVIGSVAPIVLNPLFYPKIAYQSLRDFTPVSLIGAAPQLIVVNPSLPVKSVQGPDRAREVSKARLNPLWQQRRRHAAPSRRRDVLDHDRGEESRTSPTRARLLALLDLLAGEVQVVFADMPVALPHVKAGKLRAIAVAGAKPFRLTPGIPTAIEAGLPGFALDNWWGLLMMKGVPQSIVSKINAEIVKALKQPDVIERYTALGHRVGDQHSTGIYRDHQVRPEEVSQGHQGRGIKTES